MANVIENPILNSPYEAPTRYWKFDDDGITHQPHERWGQLVKPRGSPERLAADYVACGSSSNGGYSSVSSK